MANLKVGIQLDDGQFKSALAGDKNAIGEFVSAGGDANNRLNEIVQKFDQASQRTDNYKASIRQMTAQISALSIEYNKMSETERSSDFGKLTKQNIDSMIDQVGKLKMTMADAKKAISSASSHTEGWQALSDSMNMVGMHGQAMIGIMSQLGGNTQNYTQALVGLQSIQMTLPAIMNAVNMAQSGSNVSRAAGAIITKVFGEATRSAAIAQTALNVAMKANILLTILSLVAELVMTYRSLTGASNEAADATKKLGDSQETASHKFDQEQATIKNNYITTMSKLQATYKELQTAYTSMSSQHEKLQWIKNNQDKLHELGLSVNSVTDADNVFIKNTDKIISSFKLRAQAAADQAKIESLYAENMRLQDEQALNRSKAMSKYKAGDNIDLNNAKSLKLKKGDYESGFFQGTYKLTEQGAVNANRYNAAHANDFNSFKVNYNNSEINRIARHEASLNSQVNSTLGSNYYDKSNTKSTGSSKSNSNVKKFYNSEIKDIEKETNKVPEPKPDFSGLSDEDKQIAEATVEQVKTWQTAIDKLQQGINKGKYSPTGIKEAKKDIEDYGKKLDDAKTKIKEYQNISDLKNDAKQKAADKKKISDITSDVTKPSKTKDKNDINSLDFSGLTRDGQKYATNMVEYINKIKKAMKSLQDIINDPKSSPTMKKDAQKQLTSYTKEIGSATSEVKQMNKESDKFTKGEKHIRNLQKAGSAAAESIGSLGNAFAAAGDESTAATMNMVGTTISGVSQMLPSLLALFGQKQAVAMVSGVSSASSLPFPENIVAIGTVMSTLIGVFATILSSTKHADGGILPQVFSNASKIGDFNIARVNGGEMMLNTTQQAKLFNVLAGPDSTQQSSIGVTQKIKITGSDMYILLKNYNKLKSGKDIGIK